MATDRTFSFEIKGIDEVIKNIKKAGRLGIEAGNRGIEQFAQFIGSEAMKIAPFDEGALADSYVRDLPVRNMEKVIGFNIAYAAIQHEDETFNHPGPRSKNPARGAKGQAKYLEKPMREHAGKMKQFVADEVNKVL